MTATCPPELETEILEQLSISNCLVIRAVTPRPEISYNVHILGSKGSAESWLMESVQQALASYEAGDKALVFCRSHATTERLASLLKCPSYHRDGRTVDDLRIIYDRFLEDDSQNILVATSLLGAGVDIAHVRHVWHFGIPWSLIDYVQETGRGGRDGRPAFSHVITWLGELKGTGREMNYTEDAMRQWTIQKSSCRRVLIGQVLDNKPTSCVLLRHSNYCDCCRVAAQDPRPPSGITFFPAPILVAPVQVPPPLAHQPSDPSPPTHVDAPPPTTSSQTSDPGPATPVHDPSPPLATQTSTSFQQLIPPHSEFMTPS